MSFTAPLRCQWCRKGGFKSERGLTQHTYHCTFRPRDSELHLYQAQSDDLDGDQAFQCDNDDQSLEEAPPEDAPSPPQKPRGQFREHRNIEVHDMDVVTRNLVGGALYDSNMSSDSSGSDDSDRPPDAGFEDSCASPDDKSQLLHDMSLDSDILSEDVQDSDVGSMHGVPDTTMRARFYDFVTERGTNYVPFTTKEKTAMQCLSTLQSKRAPMNAYQPMMEWHLKASGKMRQNATLQDSPDFIGRKAMLKRLAKRYNMEGKMPYERRTKLPVSGHSVKITCHDALEQIQSLLTDPRIKDEDYLFYNDDPLASPPPPEERMHVEDLNTGQAHIDTHALLIGEADNKQLLPIVLHIDGTAVSQFRNLEVISVRFSLGIFTKEARRLDHCWRSLGYVVQNSSPEGTSATVYKETEHLAVQDDDSVDSGCSFKTTEGVGDHATQDFHAQLEVILEGLVELQETGFIWDLRYKNRTYHDLHFEVFVPFVKCDTKEGDILCGKFTARTNTNMLCRYCHIPLQDADNHLYKIQYKTQDEIGRLVDAEDEDGLTNLSQVYLQNAMHKVRFSMGNRRGIHGSCPSEMLHALLLGIFKYIREIFFDFLGKDSLLAKEVNGLAQLYAKLFRRQSERDLPGTAFTQGIRFKKMMAKDFRGVLLIMMTILRSTKGKELVSKKRQRFGREELLEDWILLIEVMLEWEAYLNEPRMELGHLKRLEKKHRYIMYLIRKVTPRETGMGLKLMKFHAILHLAEDIIQFGVPTEVDTSSNEGHHKVSKCAAILTQRCQETFHFQCATRHCEFLLIDLAMFEIEYETNVADYCAEFEDESGPDQQNPDVFAPNWVGQAPKNKTGGAKLEVYKDADTGQRCWQLISGSKLNSNVKINACFVKFVYNLQKLVRPYLHKASLDIFTEHTRDGLKFRAAPNYRGKGPWRDWAIIDWGRSWGRIPGHIWAFVDLAGLNSQIPNLQYGGVTVKPGVYAVVESASYAESDEEESEEGLMRPILKEAMLDEGGLVVKRKFYLADTEAFAEPCCVVPDIGGPQNRHFQVKPRSEWKNLFIRWVMAPHNRDMHENLDD